MGTRENKIQGSGGDNIKLNSSISKRSVFYQTAVLTFSAMGLQAMGFLYRMMQSRLAGAQGMGMYTLTSPIYSLIVSVALSGICMAVNHMAAEAAAVKDYGALPRIFQAGVCFFVVLFLMMGLILLVFRNEIAVHLLGDGRTMRAMLLFLPCIFLTGFENLCKNICMGLREVRYPVISELVEQALRMAAVGGLLWSIAPETPQGAAECMILGMTVSEVFSSLFMTLALGRVLRTLVGTVKPRRKKIYRSLIRIAVPVSLSAVAGNILGSIITVTLPKRLILYGMNREGAVAALGVINAMAAPLMFLPLSLIGPMASAISPKITGSDTLGDRKDAERKSTKALEMTGLIAIPFCFSLVCPGMYIMEVIFDQAVEERILLLLALSAIFAAFQSVTSGILVGYGRQKEAMAFNLLGGGLHLSMMWLLTPRIGLMGTLWGSLAGNVLPVILSFLALRWRISIRIPIEKAVVRPLGIALCCFFTGRAAWLLGGRSLWGAVGACIVEGGLYLVLILLTGYKPGHYIRTLIPKEKLEKTI